MNKNYDTKKTLNRKLKQILGGFYFAFNALTPIHSVAAPIKNPGYFKTIEGEKTFSTLIKDSSAYLSAQDLMFFTRKGMEIKGETKVDIQSLGDGHLLISHKKITMNVSFKSKPDSREFYVVINRSEILIPSHATAEGVFSLLAPHIQKLLPKVADSSKLRSSIDELRPTKKPISTQSKLNPLSKNWRMFVHWLLSTSRAHAQYDLTQNIEAEVAAQANANQQAAEQNKPSWLKSLSTMGFLTEILWFAAAIGLVTILARSWSNCNQVDDYNKSCKAQTMTDGQIASAKRFEKDISIYLWCFNAKDELKACLNEADTEKPVQVEKTPKEDPANNPTSGSCESDIKAFENSTNSDNNTKQAQQCLYRIGIDDKVADKMVDAAKKSGLPNSPTGNSNFKKALTTSLNAYRTSKDAQPTQAKLSEIHSLISKSSTDQYVGPTFRSCCFLSSASSPVNENWFLILKNTLTTLANIPQTAPSPETKPKDRTSKPIQ